MSAEPELQIELDGPRRVADVDVENAPPIELYDAPRVVDESRPGVVADVALSQFCTCSPPPLAARRPGSNRNTPRYCSVCDKQRAPVNANAPRSTTSSEPPAEIDVRRDIALGSPVAATNAPAVAPRIVPVVQLKRGDLVAGAAATGHGVLVGWTGSGNMTRTRIIETLTNAQIPAEWAPEARSARAQAGNAVQTLRGRGYVVRDEPKDARPADASYDTLWRVVDATLDGGPVVVGDSFGTVVLVCTLTAGVLRYSGDEMLGEHVVDDYRKRIGEELYRAADVSRWLSETLYDRLGAVKFGGVWYVPRAHAETASRLCDTFSRVWGTEWLVPTLPIATSAQLQDGLVVGLTKEVDDVCAQLDAQRENAQTKGGSDVGKRAATSHMTRVREITERVHAYGALLGVERVERLRARLADAALVVDSLLDDTTQRFAALWDEVERDMRKAGNGGAS